MNDTTLLLVSPVVLDRVKVDPDGTRVVHVMTMDTARACPSCGVPSTSVKGMRVRRHRDVPYPVPATVGVAETRVTVPGTGVRDFGLSWPVVHAAFLHYATAVLPQEPEPVVAGSGSRSD
jgi:hypothetical protein